MKKSYSKPLLKKLIKGAASDYKEFQEVHTVFIKHGNENPSPGMTHKEVKDHISKMHIVLLLANIPDNIDDGDDSRLQEIIQGIVDADFNNLKRNHSGYNMALYIKNLMPELTEVSLNKDSLRDQIKAERLLHFLKDQEKRISNSEIDSKRPDSEYTVKSIILAYYYMYKKGIYPIIELSKSDFILKEVHDKLHDKYGYSADSFRNDWNPIFKDKTKRLAWAPNIELAIKLLVETKYSAHPEISKSIKLAKEELQEAKLKS